MVFNEAQNFLWKEMAYGQDKDAVKRLKDYQRTRLRRALLARSIRSYFLEASWTNTTGLAGEQTVAMTQPVTMPLLVLGGAIRTTDIGASGSPSNNNFEIQMRRTGSDKVQPTVGFVKDEHLLTPWQLSIQDIDPVNGPLFGHGSCWPITWPVPIKLKPNEVLQLTANVLAGGVPAGETTFAQFRCASIDNRSTPDDVTIADLRQWIKDNPRQRPVYLSMFTKGSRSVAFPNTGTGQHTTAQTREVEAPLLVLGYSMLTARNRTGGLGSSADPKWRLNTTIGYAFSKEEIDCNTFAFAGPGYFWQELPHPFLLPKGAALIASFSSRGDVSTALEKVGNYVIFRCVSV